MSLYNPDVIRDHARRLYDDARRTPALYFFIGMAAGIIFFAFLGWKMTNSFDAVIISVGVLTGGVFGQGIGRNRADELRLQAQMALCQLQIEENTRPRRSESAVSI